MPPAIGILSLTTSSEAARSVSTLKKLIANIGALVSVGDWGYYNIEFLIFRYNSFNIKVVEWCFFDCSSQRENNLRSSVGSAHEDPMWRGRSGAVPGRADDADHRWCSRTAGGRHERP